MNQKNPLSPRHPIDFQRPEWRRLAERLARLFPEMPVMQACEWVSEPPLEAQASESVGEPPLEARASESVGEPPLEAQASESVSEPLAELRPIVCYSLAPARKAAMPSIGLPELDPQLAGQTVSLRHFSKATRQYMIRYQSRHTSVTVEDFSAEIGINKSYYYKIVNGERRPARDTAIAMAVCFGLTADEAQDYLLLLGDQLSEAVKRDYLILYCLRSGYSLDETDSVLLHFDSEPLVRL